MPGKTSGRLSAVINYTIHLMADALHNSQPHFNNSSCHHHLLPIPSSSLHLLHPNSSNTSSLTTDTQPRSSSDGPSTHLSKLSPRTSACSSISKHKQQQRVTKILPKKQKKKIFIDQTTSNPPSTAQNPPPNRRLTPHPPTFRPKQHSSPRIPRYFFRLRFQDSTSTTIIIIAKQE